MEKIDVRPRGNTLKDWVMILLFLICFALLILLLNIDPDRNNTRIVSVNVTSLLNGFKHKVMNISDEDKLKKIVKAYTNILSSTLNNYAQYNNYEIVSYKVVVAGIPDKTKEVEKLINATFKIPVSHNNNGK